MAGLFGAGAHGNRAGFFGRYHCRPSGVSLTLDGAAGSRVDMAQGRSVDSRFVNRRLLDHCRKGAIRPPAEKIANPDGAETIQRLKSGIFRVYVYLIVTDY